jgi:hypothetical protein
MLNTQRSDDSDYDKPSNNNTYGGYVGPFTNDILQKRYKHLWRKILSYLFLNFNTN